MAKVTGGLLSLGASGSIAKTLVASKWKGRPYMRQHVIPSNPKSVAQTTTRSTFSNGGSIWKSAPTLLQAPWDRFAVGQVLTGRNAFMGRFVADNRGQVDLLSMTMSPGAKGGLAPLTLVTTPGVGTMTCDVTVPAVPLGWTIEAVVVAAIRDQDPETGTLFTVTADEDLVAPYSIVLAGLTSAVLYVFGAWIRWVKPDLSIAYGPSILDSDSPT